MLSKSLNCTKQIFSRPSPPHPHLSQWNCKVFPGNAKEREQRPWYRMDEVTGWLQVTWWDFITAGTRWKTFLCGRYFLPLDYSGAFLSFRPRGLSEGVPLLTLLTRHPVCNFAPLLAHPPSALCLLQVFYCHLTNLDNIPLFSRIFN